MYSYLDAADILDPGSYHACLLHLVTHSLFSFLRVLGACQARLLVKVLERGPAAVT